MQNLRNEQDLAFIDSHLPWPSDYVLNNEIPVNHSKIIDSDVFLYWPGYVGPFLYDATVALGMAACKASSGVANFTGEEMFQNFIGMEFEGASSNVTFEDTGTRKADSALFSLTNFVVDEETAEEEVKFLRVKRDIWRNGTWYSVKAPFVFNDGSTTPPADLPPITVDQNHLSKGFRAVGGILCAIIVCMSIVFGVWTYRNRAVQVIRASQPIFLYIIAIGTLLMGISIIPLSVDRGASNEQGASIACMAVPWFITFGFSLIFSALFTKTWRIYTIMKNAKKFKRIKLTVMDVIKPMAFLLSLNIIILSVWTAIDPLKSNIEIARTDEFDRTLESYAVCQSDYGHIFLPILLSINLGCLLVTVIQACRARHISTELSESKYILRALWIILYVSFLAVPIIIIARDKAEAFYFVVTGFIFVVCTSILLLIFGPKILAVREKKKNKTDPPNKQWGLAANKKASNGEENKANSLDIEGSSTSDSSSGIKIMGINKSTTLRNENEVMRRENEELKRLLDEAGIEYQPKERNGEASQQ